MSFPIKAGNGEHKIYIIPSAKPKEELKKEYYLEIYAGSWFVNKENNWFSNNTVTGTLTFQPAKQDSFNVGLGTYELKGQAKFAPVFNKEVFPASRYKFNNIQLTAFFHGIRKDTDLARILKSAGDASLKVVSGLASSVSVGTVAKPLVAAGTDIVSGIQDIIKSSKENKFRIFDNINGLVETIRGDQIEATNAFRLLHRGSELDQSKLSIGKEGVVNIPKYENKPLEDGAWILLELRLLSEFPYERPWYTQFEKLRVDLDGIVEDVIELGAITREDALKAFETSTSGKPSLLDQYIILREMIKLDQVLIKEERATISTAIKNKYLNAKKAIEGKNKGLFTEGNAESHAMLAGNKAMNDEMVNLINESLQAVDEYDTQNAGDILFESAKSITTKGARSTDFDEKTIIGNSKALRFLEPIAKENK